jgi:hypothetical protein
MSELRDRLVKYAAELRHMAEHHPHLGLLPTQRTREAAQVMTDAIEHLDALPEEREESLCMGGCGVKLVGLAVEEWWCPACKLLPEEREPPEHMDRCAQCGHDIRHQIHVRRDR